jgi:hypothetical protein
MRNSENCAVIDLQHETMGKFNDFLVIFQYGPMMKISTTVMAPMGP